MGWREYKSATLTSDEFFIFIKSKARLTAESHDALLGTWFWWSIATWRVLPFNLRTIDETCNTNLNVEMGKIQTNWRAKFKSNLPHCSLECSYCFIIGPWQAFIPRYSCSKHWTSFKLIKFDLQLVLSVTICHFSKTRG